MLQIKVAVVLILCCGLMMEVTAYRRHHRPRKSSPSSSSSESSKHGDGNGLGERVAVLEGLVAALQNEQASTNSILGQLNASLQQCKDDYANLADVLETKCDDLQEQLDAIKAKLEEICEALDPCTPNPCPDDVQCTAIGLKDYQCQCTSRWIGKTCSSDHVCHYWPCNNGGICVEDEESYKCKCVLENGVGPNCATVPPCKLPTQPCGIHGTCTTIAAAPYYECECVDGYTGENCGQPPAPLAGNGKEASFDSAQFIFSQDAACTDTQRIFESTAYLDEHLSVFHANYISECVKKQSKEAVPLGKYILLSAETQEAVRTGMRIKFHWETDGNTSDGQSVNSDNQISPGDSNTSDGQSVNSESEDEIAGNHPDNQSHKKSESQQHPSSSQARNQSGTRNNERTKENQSKESQQHPSSSHTRNQSGTRNNETTKENQSGITGQTSTEKSKSEAPEVITQDKQSHQPNKHSYQPNRQSNQSNVASQSKQLQQYVNANSSQKETVKDNHHHSSNDTEMVDKDLRSSRSPRKHGQTKTEENIQGKRLKVTEPTAVIAEKEEVWRLENLAKVMDRIDEFTVGQCGFDVYDKRRSKTGH